MMTDFLLEIGCEEMPARFFPKLTDELKEKCEANLKEANIDFGEVQTFGTPRRLTLFVRELSGTQKSEIIEVSGPPKKIAYTPEGEPTKAAQGFAKSQGIELDDIYIKETDKGEYLAAKVKTGGKSTIELLPDMCAAWVTGLDFPKSMRWGNETVQFGRPLQSLLALYGEKAIRFSVADVESGSQTIGHRIMGRGPWPVKSPADYFDVLREKGMVILDRQERRNMILEKADELAALVGGSVVWNEDLLDEVCGLVEYPRPILASFEERFLEVPWEVLITSMESHQKSFGVAKKDDPERNLLPHFIATLNLEPKDIGVVEKGWERVLRARLEDARFFWETDLNIYFETRLAELENVVFISSLGSMGDKSRRLEIVCRGLADVMQSEFVHETARAGRLAKADLVSEMVGEFDELQGIMGGIYAEKSGEPPLVAQALSEQYLPAGPSSPVPHTEVGSMLSMVDKVDTIMGCFGMDMAPTGANDPNGLRRAALGIIRIILENGFSMHLDELFRGAFKAYEAIPGKIPWKHEPETIFANIQEFFARRLKAYYISKGHSTLVIEAALGAGHSDLRDFDKRVQALEEFSKRDDFEQAVLTFKRASNIVTKQGGEGLTGKYKVELMLESQEKALADKLVEVGPRFDELAIAEDYATLLDILGELRPYVDDFFDNVMVMSEDKKLKKNRLNLLKALLNMLSDTADFGALQV
jgi:glycyl-tRNA synthetase beta chain